MRVFTSVTDGAELYSVRLSLFVAAILSAGCGDAGPARVDGVYAHASRALVRLDSDYDGDGRIDARTYMRKGRPIRVEADGTRDGVIDRWEYYDASGSLLRIGGSTRADGVEDTWVRLRGDERFVETSTHRDGAIDRREVYRGGSLQRTESDTNADGYPDVWEELEGGRVARVLIDDSSSHRGPTRRIVYGTGTEPRIEIIGPGDTRAAR